MAAIRFLVEAGHSVDLWSPKADGDGTTGGYRIAKSSKTLKASYDVAWSMDNWYHKHIAWAASAVEYAKQNLGVKIAIDGTGDYLKKAKAHLAQAKPGHFTATVQAERKLWAAVDLLLTCSSSVAADIADDPHKPVKMGLMTLPLAPNNALEPRSFRAAEKHSSICLPGSLHDLNHQGFDWFIKRVWPLLQQTHPNLILRVIGGGTESLASACEKIDNVAIMGRVDDFSAEVSRSLLSVVPAEAPGGLKTVVADSLLAGTPVIGAPSNNKGMGLSDSISVMSASYAEEYAAKITDFLDRCSKDEEAIDADIMSAVNRYKTKNDFNLAMKKIVDVIKSRSANVPDQLTQSTRTDPELLLVGTYHKTGTVLMNRIFKELARRTSVTLEDIQQPEKSFVANTPSSAKRIIFDYKCLFENIERQSGTESLNNVKGVRIIRDPRMLLISATRYHLTSSEPWLHQPIAALRGLTYQQYLCALPNFEEQMKFEMANASKVVISSMLAFEEMTIARHFITAKLEDLMQDESLEIFFKLFRHLDFKGEEMVVALHAALKNSVFKQGFKKSEHMRGRLGEDWAQYFTPELLYVYQQMFGDAHNRLGYR